jgi:hypothetical protein
MDTLYQSRFQFWKIRKICVIFLISNLMTYARPMNGWITKELWTYYARLFSAQIRGHWLSLPIKLMDSDIWLIIDGRKNRLNFTAALIFPLNGIDVNVLLAHSSYFL